MFLLAQVHSFAVEISCVFSHFGEESGHKEKGNLVSVFSYGRNCRHKTGLFESSVTWGSTSSGDSSKLNLTFIICQNNVKHKG